MRVVVVSDDPLFVETVSFGFRADGGFQVYHCPAATRVPATAIARVGRDAVLIDDAGGADAPLDLVRELSGLLDRPAVLVLSGAGHPRPDRFLELGATAVISKSIHSRTLAIFVRETLAGRIVVGVGRGTGADADAHRPAVSSEPPAPGGRLIVAA